MKDLSWLTGQEKYLMGVELYYINYEQFSPKWDHDHCEFCWAKFSLFENDLHQGYCTSKTNDSDANWICPKCYDELKEKFKWKVITNE